MQLAPILLFDPGMETLFQRPCALLGTLSLIVLPACSQGTLNRSASDIISSVVLAGGPMGGRGEPSSSAPSGTRVIGTAEHYLGVPYRWGGSTPDEGFDCSGYVRYVYRQQGVQLPRTSREQAGAGEAIPARVRSLRAGDLMMFAESRGRISHVGIYAGEGRMIHSSSSGGGVRFDALDTRRGQWFTQHLVGARRLAVNGRSLVQSLELLARPNMTFDPPDHAPAPRR